MNNGLPTDKAVSSPSSGARTHSHTSPSPPHPSMASASSAEFHSIMRRVLDKTIQMLQSMGQEACLQSLRTSSSGSVHPTKFTLQAPQPITAALVSKGLSFHHAQVVSGKYLAETIRLKVEVERRIATIADRWIADNPGNDISSQISRMQSLYASHYSQKAKEWADRSILVAEERICALRRSGVPAHPITFSNALDRRPAFKQVSQTMRPVLCRRTDRPCCLQEGIPLLEEFFRRNAYPTRDDKLRLAQNTGMDYRQIHVWVSTIIFLLSKHQLMSRCSSFKIAAIVRRKTAKHSARAARPSRMTTSESVQIHVRLCIPNPQSSRAYILRYFCFVAQFRYQV